jgi:hypothetical protein
MEHIVEDVDYVREIMVVDVRYKPDNPLIGPRNEARDRR